MGIRSGGKPSPEHSFVQRFLHAIDMRPIDLAREIGAGDPALTRTVRETLETWINKPADKLPDVDRDWVWFKILEYIDQQYGYLMAAKHELNVLLHRQRVSRAKRQLGPDDLDGGQSVQHLPRRRP